MKTPAVLGGVPAFEAVLDIVKPALPSLDAIAPRLERAMQTGRITNNSQFVRELEELVCDVLQVRNCVAMCNGTLTLILALKGMGLRGKVVVPSFTFCATVHAVVWAGLEPLFADVDADTFNVTPETVEVVLTDDVSGIMPVHVFGSPCEIAGLESLAREHGVKLFFDSAQAVGSKYRGRRLGSFGDAESFSLHATKILPSGEGGLLTTEDDGLAGYLRSARNFGVQGDVDCTVLGLNAKMAEFPALLGIEGLKNLDRAIAHRRRLVAAYQELLAPMPGLRSQSHLADAETNHQNFVVIVDGAAFGLSRDELLEALKVENITGRRYFYPAVHSTSAYARYFAAADPTLPATVYLSERALCLPLHSEMSFETVDRICEAVRSIHSNARAVRDVLA